ncbi:GNAT family N-acetyltransferase [Arenicella sp.]|nr:GNAT family N-acetyltransferase [Arenicella sp.]
MIRPATPDDVSEIHTMIGELAEFEKLADQFVASVDELHGALFGERPAADALVAEGEDGLVGYAIFFTTFSTFLAKQGLWLEDVYVRPDQRGKGLGKGLVLAGAKMAEERGYGRYEWCVLDWNQNAIEFYDSLGTDILHDWRIVRSGEGQIRKMTAVSRTE